MLYIGPFALKADPILECLFDGNFPLFDSKYNLFNFVLLV